MDLQESKLYDLDLGVKVTQNVAQHHPHHVTYAPVNFEVTQNVVQCPPNHMTYAPAKFEVATSNSLGEDGFTRK